MKVPLAFLRVSQKKKTLFALQQPHTTLPASWERGGQHVADPRWGAEDRVTIRPLCREWTSAPFITSFQLKPSKKWLNNQLQANGAIYPCYGRTLVIDLGMSGQRQMSHSNGKGVRRMTERRVIRNKEKEMLISLMGEGCWGCKHESQGKKEKQSSRREFGHIMEHSHFNVSHMCSRGWCCRLRQNDEGKSRTCISGLASGDTENVMIVPWQRASCRTQLQSLSNKELQDRACCGWRRTD